jgi:hypothetical protein
VRLLTQQVVCDLRDELMDMMVSQCLLFLPYSYHCERKEVFWGRNISWANVLYLGHFNLHK